MTALFTLIATGLVILTVAIHLFLLRGLSNMVSRMRAFPVIAMGSAMVAAILAHLVEIWIFAFALKYMCANGRFGQLVGDVQHQMRDYFYWLSHGIGGWIMATG
jgi:hypothetical protein